MSEDVKGIDSSIDEYIKDNNSSAFVTSWVVVASISSPEHDIGSEDGYVTITSEGLPHHSKLGLLTMANQDLQSMAIISAMSNIFASRVDDDDEWDGDE